MEEIVNRVAKSPLLSLDLEDFYQPGERVVYDLEDNLYEGLLLREKDFRAFLKAHDWSQYQDKYVALTCSAEAIVPTWAFMLVSIHLEPYAKKIVYGNPETLEESLFQEELQKLDVELYRDKKVVVKGCGDLPVPISAYVMISQLLRPVVQSIMYGEPCSTVPLYKKARPKK